MKLSRYLLLIFGMVFLFAGKAQAQSTPYFVPSYPDTLHKKRLTLVLGSQGVAYGSMITILYQAWYKNYPQSKFHWFDDNDEWLQMDKIGHATTAAYFGKFGYEFYRWAGVERKKAIWIGGSAGFIFLTTIEILDGFSEQWGASSGDLIANTAGTALFIGQQLGWDEQRFYMKWSYHPSEYAQYRPDLLGSGGIESALKDYNGQTYWLSGNVKAFLPSRSKFPSWLSVSVGYGASGMTGAKQNSEFYKGEEIPEFTRYRQYFLSLDVDLSRIKTRSRTLKFFLNLANFIKIPFPTLEYNSEQGVVFHPIYF
ncbi:MAG: DUF2279 domain-containing protein [Chlorobi bacterium]|nr:DUF2279 domain-containing protein [Chlorobiota bacterium]